MMTFVVDRFGGRGMDPDAVAGWGLEGTLFQVILLLLRSGMDAIVVALWYGWKLGGRRFRCCWK